MSQEEEIEKYLKDKNLLYRDWYVLQTQHERGIDYAVPVGAFEDHKKFFEQWVNQHHVKLAQHICPNREKIKSYQKIVDCVSFIMVLIKDMAFVGGLLQCASALFDYGIENLCKSYDAEKK